MLQKKKADLNRLLSILGPSDDLPPSSLREAREMSEPLDRVEMERCGETDKVCFTSESQANAAAKSRLRKGANTGKLRVYRCPHCNQFHFSSSFRS